MLEQLQLKMIYQLTEKNTVGDLTPQEQFFLSTLRTGAVIDGGYTNFIGEYSPYEQVYQSLKQKGYLVQVETSNL